MGIQNTTWDLVHLDTACGICILLPCTKLGIPPPWVRKNCCRLILHMRLVRCCRLQDRVSTSSNSYPCNRHKQEVGSTCAAHRCNSLDIHVPLARRTASHHLVSMRALWPGKPQGMDCCCNSWSLHSQRKWLVNGTCADRMGTPRGTHFLVERSNGCHQFWYRPIQSPCM